jgi:hypothetical protein
MRWEIFMVMKVQVVLFCVRTPSSNVVGYQHFRWPSCPSLQGEVNSADMGREYKGVRGCGGQHCRKNRPGQESIPH